MKLLAATFLLCCAAGVAHAEGYAEGVVGIAIPIADDDYSEFDEALKLGVRAGSGGPMAVEFAGDYTNYQATDLGVLGTLDFTRYRAMFGVRQHVTVGKKNQAALFVRGNVGVDIMQLSFDSPLGDESET